MSSPMKNSLRIRELGYTPGSLEPGPTNSILDVPGVHVSQLTVPTTTTPKDKSSTATKGVTIILPRPPKDFHKPCHASSFVFNGNGELTGTKQIADWGFVNMPIALTNSLSLGAVFDGCWDWVLDQQDELGWDGLARARNYGTPVVGETSDWWINSDVRLSRLSKEDVVKAFGGLKSREDGAVVHEGQFGGGASMTCHQFTAGTGTASRKISGDAVSGKTYTLGVLCQSNYGHRRDLIIGGIPVGRILLKEDEAAQTSSVPSRFKDEERKLAGRTDDGSIVIIIVTDAPLATHQLNRLARHATAGLTLVGSHGVGRTFSGDIFLAVSTADHPSEQLSEDIKIGYTNPVQTYNVEVVKNESIDGLFQACVEATEEAILNSLVGGRSGTIGLDGTKIDGLPVEKVKEILSKHLVTV